MVFVIILLPTVLPACQQPPQYVQSVASTTNLSAISVLLFHAAIPMSLMKPPVPVFALLELMMLHREVQPHVWPVLISVPTAQYQSASIVFKDTMQ